jgi:A/G-specific adenine glycosylase
VFNQALMEIGALICKPAKPQCHQCPLRSECLAFAKGRTDVRPRKRTKPAIRMMRIQLYVVSDLRGRILMRRESGRLMDGMFHLPHGNASLLRGPRLAIRSMPAGTFRHTVTNRRITFEVRTAKGQKPPAGYRWIALEELSALPHPSYVRKALRLAGIAER